jgi:hypothetical protein
VPKRKKKYLQAQLDEADICAGDYEYWAQYHAEILNGESGRFELIKRNHAQKVIKAALDENPWQIVLKARQLGSTTEIALENLHAAQFIPGTRVAVIAQSRDAAENIFEIYRRAYEGQPEYLKVPTKSASVRQLKFIHGSSILVGTYDSESWRGGTYNRIHATEVAFWGDLKKGMAAIFMAATANAVVILETTANGVGNEFYRMWHATHDGFGRQFLSWTDGERYVSKDKPKKLHPDELKYIQDRGLPKKRAYWFVKTLRTRCGGDMQLFNQEFPTTPAEAFIASGSRFFSNVYPDAYKDARAKKRGWIRYKGIPPKTDDEKKEERDARRFRLFAMGIDTASGGQEDEHDYSAATLRDITNKHEYSLVWSFLDRISMRDFARTCHKMALEYNALVVIEANSYGQAVVDYFLEKGYPYLYKRVVRDKVGDQLVERVGVVTGGTHSGTRARMLAKLHEAYKNGWADAPCPRLQEQINAFHVNDKGKPEAQSGAWDDLVMADSMCIESLEQGFHYGREIQFARRPRTNREYIEWEAQTGKDPDKYNKRWMDTPVENHLFTRGGQGMAALKSRGRR